MKTKIFLIVCLLFSLYVFSTADCPGNPPSSLIPTTTQQVIFFYNPGGVNNPEAATCTATLGYNVPNVGLIGTLSYCTVMQPGDSVVLVDGGPTNVTIDAARCAANGNGTVQIPGGLYNGTYGNFITAYVTITTNQTKFALSFKPGPITGGGQQTTPAALPTVTYNGGGPNPQGARMDLAIVVDISLGRGGTFFNTTTIPIIGNLTEYFQVGTLLNTTLTRLTLARVAPQQTLGSTIVPAWTTNKLDFQGWLKTLFLPGTSNSWYSPTLTTLIKDIFGYTGDTPARNQTQKVLLIFVNNDANISDSTNDIIGLANTIMQYDIHTVFVYMNNADLAPRLTNTLQPNLKGSNSLQTHTYLDADGVDGTVYKLFSNYLMNGNTLCGIGANNVITITPSPSPTPSTFLPFKLPIPNGLAPQAQIQRQAYCNYMTSLYSYIPTSNNNVVVTITQLETTPGVDFVDVYNSTDLVASFSGREVSGASVCFTSPSNVTIGFVTLNSWVLSGAIVTVTESGTACPVINWPITYYRRKK